MEVNKPKPLGIILIIVYSVISALMGLSLSIGVFTIISIMSVPIWIYLVTITTFTSSIFLLASVYGLWTYQRWGLNLVLLLYIIQIPLSAILIFPTFPGDSVTTPNTILQLTSIAISFSVLFYLLRVDVNFRFK